ncbi:MAG: class I SAM-dependent methyltransferase, partial [Bacteroidales bacterium]|nr:class I SAM-dependent methyltransferase [Bacteroidales bacterium]MBN2819301.1 class I SAM-dependent methyltransferase [Bacteroidales bacterium]
GKTLLDVGCGTGYFPRFMQQGGFDAEGMEMDADARAFAGKNFGLKIHSPQELLEQKIYSKYDVITLWHVLEHLQDADSYLSWIYTALKKKGYLFIALPNCNSYDAEKFDKYWAAYDVPRHLWHFTPKTLKALLKRHNFELAEIKRLPFDAYYNSLMSAKYAGKSMALINGFFIGFISNLVSFFNPEKSSSVIYILTKAGE